jgi:hypothetical protein
MIILLQKQSDHRLLKVTEATKQRSLSRTEIVGNRLLKTAEPSRDY